MTDKKVDIACECWFTKSGKMTPIMIKFPDESGEIISVKEILVLSQETRFPGSNPITEFRCQIMMNNTKKPVSLFFSHKSCTWQMAYSS